MDIASNFDPVALRADFALANGALQSDADLRTAVVISLFTNRRAEPDDVLPEGQTSRQGWWGDALADIAGSGGAGAGAGSVSAARIGSRLWLLSREKIKPETLSRAREYAQEALDWMVAQDVAQRVQVQTQVAGPGVLGLSIDIKRHQGAAVRYRFALAWQQLQGQTS